MSRETHCKELVGPGKSGKVLVINRPKWNNLMQNLRRGEREQEMREKELQFNEYLKEGSRGMTRRWENSVEKRREQKSSEKLRLEEAKVAEGELRFKKIKENDENKRLEMVNETKTSLQQLKCGSRELDSAYVLSEVLQCREIQCAQNAKERIFRKERELAFAREHIAQESQWNEVEGERLLSAKKRKDAYKKQLFKHIEENDLRKKENARNVKEQIRYEREEDERDLQIQLERERAILQKKKEAMRKNALEAMRIAEQRRLRVKMENEIENKIISIFAKKSVAEEVKEENDNAIAIERERLRQLIAEKLFVDNEAKQKAEQDVHSTAIQENEIKFSKLEQAKLEQMKKLKAARIQQYIDDMNRMKKIEQEKVEQHHWDEVNRFKNEEVNVDYDRKKRVQEMKKMQGHRLALQKQIQEKKMQRSPEYVDQSVIDNIEDDKHFLKRANELIGEAKAKNRNIYPLLKAVECYKKSNNLKDEILCLKSNDGGLNETPIKYNINQLKKMNVGLVMVPKRCPQTCAVTCASPLKLNVYRNVNNSCK